MNNTLALPLQTVSRYIFYKAVFSFSFLFQVIIILEESSDLFVTMESIYIKAVPTA